MRVRPGNWGFFGFCGTVDESRLGVIEVLNSDSLLMFTVYPACCDRAE